MNTTKREVDVAIVGAGTAGLVARRQALAHGAERVLLIEGGPYGTTCARVGCMPSKLLIAAADAAHELRHAAQFGLHAGPIQIDGEAVMARVQRERDRFAGFVVAASEALTPEQALRGWARFVGPNSLEVTGPDGQRTRVEARAVIIAAGSTPAVPPPLRGLGERLLTTDSIFERSALPRSLAVIGAGVIGLEIGQAMDRLGVRTRIFDMGTRVPMLGSALMQDQARALFSAALDLNLGISNLGAERSADAPDPDQPVRLSWTDADGHAHQDHFEVVLAATGRRPQLARLQLDQAGVALNERGLPTHWDPRTGQIEGHPIFLAGDVSGTRPLLHEAAAEGRIAGINAARWPEVRAHVRYVPMGIMFTDPQVAVVGEVPDSGAASGQGDDWEVGEVDLGDQGRARVMGRNAGHIRVYGRHQCGTIFGAELLGPRAEHLAHLLAWSIEQKLSAQRALALPYYHPVLEEGLRTAMQQLAHKLKLTAKAHALDCGPGA